MGWFTNWGFGSASPIEVVQPGNIDEVVNLSIMQQKDIQAKNIGIVFNCCTILSNNLSRMQVQIFKDEDGRLKQNQHRLTKLLGYKPNSIQSAQNFWSTVEYHRSLYGNGFAKIYTNSNGIATSFEILHPEAFKNYKMVRGKLFYYFDMSKVNTNQSTSVEAISSDNILHFKSIAFDGILGLSPLKAAQLSAQLNSHAATSVKNLYKCGSLTPMVVEDTPQSITGRPSAGSKNKDNNDDLKETFDKSYSGSINAGKVPFLPPGKTLKQIIIDYSKLQLIDTLKFSRDEIANIYSVPQWMVSDNDVVVSNIEQQSLAFINYTIAPITAIYEAELENKLLLDVELGVYSIEFDAEQLIKLDTKTKVKSIRDQVTAGLMSPQEATRKLGNKKIETKWAEKHFIQKQNHALEDWDTVDLKNNTQPNNNKKDE